MRARPGRRRRARRPTAPPPRAAAPPPRATAGTDRGSSRARRRRSRALTRAYRRRQPRPPQRDRCDELGAGPLLGDASPDPARVRPPASRDRRPSSSTPSRGSPPQPPVFRTSVTHRLAGRARAFVDYEDPFHGRLVGRMGGWVGTGGRSAPTPSVCCSCAPATSAARRSRRSSPGTCCAAASAAGRPRRSRSPARASPRSSARAMHPDSRAELAPWHLDGAAVRRVRRAAAAARR